MLQQPLPSEQPVSRRSFLQQALTLPVAILLAGCASSGGATQSAGKTATRQLATFNFVLAL